MCTYVSCFLQKRDCELLNQHAKFSIFSHVCRSRVQWNCSDKVGVCTICKTEPKTQNNYPLKFRGFTVYASSQIIESRDAVASMHVVQMASRHRGQQGASKQTERRSCCWCCGLFHSQVLNLSLQTVMLMMHQTERPFKLTFQCMHIRRGRSSGSHGTYTNPTWSLSKRRKVQTV